MLLKLLFIIPQSQIDAKGNEVIAVNGIPRRNRNTVTLSSGLLISKIDVFLLRLFRFFNLSYIANRHGLAIKIFYF